MRSNSKKVAIIIPFYKPLLTTDEQISVKHLNSFLGRYDKFLVLPDNLKKVSFQITNSKIINFPSRYFTNVSAYCELLNSQEFYQAFIKYKYILIYQLDALIFSDKLLEWCDKNFDYIGAPWLNPIIGRLSTNNKAPLSGGNGGLSLRKVKSFLEVIKKCDNLSNRKSNSHVTRKLWFVAAALTGNSHKIWLHAPAYCYPFNEDGFWSFEAVKYLKSFKVAPLSEALKFSFEKNPKKCIALNHFELPFGCHAWTRYDRNFWNQYLLKTHA